VDRDGAVWEARARELKEVGNRHFQRQRVEHALTCYAQALHLLPEAHAERAVLHSNRAACLMVLRDFAECERECSLALEIDSGFVRAIARRARARELRGRFNLALEDLRRLLREDSAGDSRGLRAMETRLLLLTGQDIGPGSPGSPGRAPGAEPSVLTVKAALGEDLRLVHVPEDAGYAELRFILKARFGPRAPDHFAVKYRDQSGDLLTVASGADFRAFVTQALKEAFGEAAAAAGSGDGGSGGDGGGRAARATPNKNGTSSDASGAPQSRSPLGGSGPGLVLVPVAAGEAPQPDEADLSAFVAKQQAIRKAAEAKKEAAAGGHGAAPAPKGPELDSWMLDFVQLFREQLGIDPDGHIDLHNEGWDQCTAAMEPVLAKPEAFPLFQQAARKFQDVTSSGYFNWGNVLVCMARRELDEAGEGRFGEGQVAGAVAKLDEADAKYLLSLSLKPNFFDATIAQGQLLFERAKLRHAELKHGSWSGTPEAAAEDVETFFQSAIGKFREAVEGLQQDSETTTVDPVVTAAPEPAGPDDEGEMSLRSQALIMWGNVLYEQSQICAGRGEEWRGLLDRAVDKFHEAKCSDADVENALRTHSMGDHLNELLESLGFVVVDGGVGAAPTVGKKRERKSKDLGAGDMPAVEAGLVSGGREL